MTIDTQELKQLHKDIANCDWHIKKIEVPMSLSYDADTVESTHHVQSVVAITIDVCSGRYGGAN